MRSTQPSAVDTQHTSCNRDARERVTDLENKALHSKELSNPKYTRKSARGKVDIGEPRNIFMGNEVSDAARAKEDEKLSIITREFAGDGHGARGTTGAPAAYADERRTFRDVYMLRSRIGKGSHSQVFRAIERSTGREVAVKVIHTDWLDRRRLAFLRAEIDIHRQVSPHPFVVRLLGVFNDPEACFIVQELAYGGSLLEHLHSRDTMETEEEVRVLLRRMLAAAQFLHDRGIVHRDIKPENLLIVEKGVMSSAKLADFGFATRLVGDLAPGGPAYGTPEYVAPEILLQQPFCGKADVWSAGVTAFCLLSGKMPFYGLTLDKLYTAILDGACSYAGTDWASVGASAKDFVQRMLRVDPAERWTAAQLLEHPWMAEGASGPADTKVGSRRSARLRSVGLAIIFLNRLLAGSGRATIAERSARQLELELGSP